MTKIVYEYINGDNSPSSELRRIGLYDTIKGTYNKEFKKEKRIREKKGYGFFKLYYSEKDLGEKTTKRELNKVNQYKEE